MSRKQVPGSNFALSDKSHFRVKSRVVVADFRAFPDATPPTTSKTSRKSVDTRLLLTLHEFLPKKGNLYFFDKNLRSVESSPVPTEFRLVLGVVGGVASRNTRKSVGTTILSTLHEFLSKKETCTFLTTCLVSRVAQCRRTFGQF